MTDFDRDPARYLPHRSPMLLIDSVEAYDEASVRCRVSLGEQCALFRQADGTYPNSLFVEFMAQAVGMYAGIRDGADPESATPPRVGFLLGSRNVTLHQTELREGDVFDIEARCVFFGEESLPSQFDCTVTHEGTPSAQAVLTVYRPSDLQTFIREISQ